MAKRSSFQNYKVKLRLIFERGFRCESCGIVPDRLELDHIKELWDGGSHEDRNLQLLCYECHKKKSIKEHKRWCRQYPQKVVVING